MQSNFLDQGIVRKRRKAADRRKVDNPNFSGVERRLSGDRRARRDNRRFPRLSVEQEFYARLYSRFNDDIGQVMDISLGGISARTISDEKDQDIVGLDIFLPKSKFIINRIPCKTVAKFRIANESPISSIVSNRYCLKFESLTAEQNSQLGCLLKSF